MTWNLIQDIVNDNEVLDYLYRAHCEDGTIKERVIPLGDRSFKICEEGIKNKN